MRVINEVSSSDPTQMEEVMKPGPDGPIFMVNLMKFKDKAEYEDGRQTDLTGREAYDIYFDGVRGILPTFGGGVFIVADLTHVFLGQVEELWDEIAIVTYPDRKALLQMSISEAWQALSVHRMAGLAGQLNIESTLPEKGPSLPWIEQFLKEIAT